MIFLKYFGFIINLSQLLAMDSLSNRWSAAIQSVEQFKNSRIETNKKEEESVKKVREVQTYTEINEPSKISLGKQDKTKQNRTKSQDRNKNSAFKDSRQIQAKKIDTPNKKRGKKQEKLIQNCANAILQIAEPAQPDKIRNKIKSLLEDLILNAVLQNSQQKTSIMKESITSTRYQDRAYCQLQQRYFECEKDRQYLKGKLQATLKRYENIQKQIDRYSKMQKLIDNSIARQAQLKQELARTQHQKQRIQTKMSEQQLIYSRQVISIRELIQTLKEHLPDN